MVSQPASTQPNPCPESNTDDRGWGELTTEMNILPVLIAPGRVHYSPQVGYHSSNIIKNFNELFQLIILF